MTRTACRWLFAISLLGFGLVGSSRAQLYIKKPPISIPPDRSKGRAAYDKFPEKERATLIQDWEDELDRTTKNIDDVSLRLSKLRVGTVAYKSCLQEWSFTRNHLDYLLKNNPPYVPRLEVKELEAKIAMLLPEKDARQLRLDDKQKQHVAKQHAVKDQFLSLAKKLPETERLYALQFVLENKKPPALDISTLLLLKTGDFGVCTGAVKVIQVPKEGTLLVQGAGRDEFELGTFVLEKISTKDVADDSLLKLDKIVWIRNGTVSYTSVLGAKKTVKRFTAVGDDDALKLLEDTDLKRLRSEASILAGDVKKLNSEVKETLTTIEELGAKAADLRSKLRGAGKAVNASARALTAKGSASASNVEALMVKKGLTDEEKRFVVEYVKQGRIEPRPTEQTARVIASEEVRQSVEKEAINVWKNKNIDERIDLARLRAETVAYVDKMKTLMEKEGLTPEEQVCVVEYVNHGRIESRPTDKVYRFVARKEVREWVGKEVIYVWENARLGKR